MHYTTCLSLQELIKYTAAVLRLQTDTKSLLCTVAHCTAARLALKRISKAPLPLTNGLTA